MSKSTLVCTLLALMACTGTIQDVGEAPVADIPIDGPPLPGEPLEVVSPIRFQQRLSRIEITSILSDVLGVDVYGDVQLLPADATMPFDNNAEHQNASIGLVEGLRAFARQVADAYASREDLLDVLQCTELDARCVENFVTSKVSLLYRRRLSSMEVAEFVSLFEAVPSDVAPEVGLAMVLEVVLLDPEFLHIVERAREANLLSEGEIAARMALLVWGSAPDEDLLRLADEGGLQDASVRVDVARRMLQDDRAKRQLQRLFAFWLGYGALDLSDATSRAVREESDALVARVLFEERGDWTNLFRADETFINATLAERYGLDFPAGPDQQWVPYGSDPRRGILSHASVLANGQKFGDTSPVQRGLFVRERLLCQTLELPDEVDIDEPPESADPTACKSDVYAEHGSGICVGCHRQLDPIGFGLERYDAEGRYRLHEPGRPDCPIEGGGTLTPLGDFEGPAELSELLAESQELHSCAVTQVFRFAVGRDERAEDRGLIAHLAGEWAEGEGAFTTLFELIIAHPTFIERIQEVAP